MTRRYTTELNKLSAVFDVARRADIGSLARSVETWISRPMIMVGSGGSYSTASFAAYLHEQFSGRLTRPATPLDLMKGTVPDAGVVCFTASGRNRDIIAAFREAARQEVSPLCALVLADDSPLAELASRTQYAEVIASSDPSYADGFLAVASLCASCLLLLRAYRAVTGVSESDLPSSLHDLIDSATSLESLDALAEMIEPLAKREYVSILYTPSLSPAAVDLESRFVEAALGALHIADLRNFGHGRHVWLAKRAKDTAVLALIGDHLDALATKTLKLLPPTASAARIGFTGPWDVQALAGILVGLHVAKSAGRIAGIDPGKPGVPSFGRSLYRLAPQSSSKKQAELNRIAVLRRKGQCEDDPSWFARHYEVMAKFNAARFDALVADYDGTLCETRARFDPLRPEVAGELARLSESGAPIGIATGRGPSAGNELRRALPEKLHNLICIGYYNGADIRSLADTSDPLLPELPADHPLLEVLSTDPVFAESTVQTRNSAQVSVSLRPRLNVNKAVSRAQYLMRRLELAGDVVASSHSIDMLLGSQSKRNVVDAVLKRSCQHNSVLRLGDRGDWPGNDAELLDDPFGLSVDDVSAHPAHCWSLSPAGVVGVQATLYYLKRLSWTKSGGRIRLTPGARA